jgi:leucine-rich repeat protein SHOC2
LFLHGNQLTSLPAEIGQLRLLFALYLDDNKLTSVPAEIHELRAMWGRYVRMDDGVTVDK